jgi:hypothetical protein
MKIIVSHDDDCPLGTNGLRAYSEARSAFSSMPPEAIATQEDREGLAMAELALEEKQVCICGADQRGNDGVPWAQSIIGSGLAEEIVRHFAETVTSLIVLRSGWIEEETGLEPDDIAEKQVREDIFNVLMGHDSGCLDPEDLDETNCSFNWTESKLRDLLASWIGGK